MANDKRNLASLFRRPALAPVADAGALEVGLLAPPADLHTAIAIELNGGNRATVYVSVAYAGHPLFLTWITSNRDRGRTINVQPVGVEEIADYRSRFSSPTPRADLDLAFRSQAIDMLRQAAAYRASDMHIRINGAYGEVQIVVKGELRVLQRLTHQAGEALIRVLYQGVARTKSDSLKPTEYQNAQIPGDVFGDDVGVTSIRVVRGPCYPVADGGQFMTLRLQYHQARPTSPTNTPGGQTTPKIARANVPSLPFPKSPAGELQLQALGYTAAQIDKLAMLMAAPSGLVLFTGPTGSGKTTSMYECLADIARKRPWDRQVTAEDPVE